MLQLIVLYPQPSDAGQFEKDYQVHLELLHEKMGIPADQRPYKVTKMMATPAVPKYYQMFTMEFPTNEALQATMSSAEMQEVGADAARISSGGAPVILIGDEVG